MMTKVNIIASYLFIGVLIFLNINAVASDQDKPGEGVAYGI